MSEGIHNLAPLPVNRVHKQEKRKLVYRRLNGFGNVKA